MVLYPWVLFRDPKKFVTDRMFRHEMEHVYQVQNTGWIKFYCLYLWYSLRHGYKQNPFEIEARAVQHRPLTKTERQLKDA